MSREMTREGTILGWMNVVLHVFALTWNLEQYYTSDSIVHALNLSY